MAINPLNLVGNQVKSAARNQVRTAQAEFRRETSIVGYANARIGAAAQRVERARKKQAAPKRAKCTCKMKVDTHKKYGYLLFSW